MTLNFPGPYQVRINYVAGGRPHTQGLNCDLKTDGGIGAAFSAHNVQTQNAVGTVLSTAVDAYITLIDNFYNSVDASFTDAELWKYSPSSDDATFHGVYALGAAGTAAGATVVAGQARLSCITALGGQMFLDFMGSKFDEAETDNAPYADADVTNLSNFLVGGSNWILGRDGAYPIATRKWNAGKNEKLWKLLNRN